MKNYSIILCFRLFGGETTYLPLPCVYFFYSQWLKEKFITKSKVLILVAFVIIGDKRLVLAGNRITMSLTIQLLFYKADHIHIHNFHSLFQPVQWL